MKFNLIDSPWIPVHFLDGTHTEIGIKEAILRSREIMELEDASPVVLVGLHRLLLAVLHRALEGPTDMVQCRNLFKVGIPTDKMESYLTDWKDRFWLFHDTCPFFQVADLKGETHHWKCLFLELNDDNGKTLFDHTLCSSPGNLGPAKAARHLVASQFLAITGGKSETGYRKQSPAATAMRVLPIGKNLHDTLLFSLVPQGVDVFSKDIPVWEKSPLTMKGVMEKQKETNTATGCVDLYTWQSRAILLKAGENSDQVEKVSVMAGLPSGIPDDPMVPWKSDGKEKITPMRLPQEGVWTAFDSLMPDQQDGAMSPRVIRHATALARTVPERFPRHLLVIGLGANQSKILRWTAEHWALPTVLIEDRQTRAEVRTLLDVAAQASSGLNSALLLHAKEQLAYGTRDMKRQFYEGRARSFPARSGLSVLLEEGFHSVVARLVAGHDQDAVRLDWTHHVLTSLRFVWDRHRSEATGSRDMRAVTLAEMPVLCAMKALQKDINALKGDSSDRT